MPVSSWSTTAADNGSTLGIDIAENCAAANMNNAAREMMAQIKAKFDAVDGSIGSGSFQPLDATLTAWAALSFAANQIAYATASDTFALTTLSSFARTLLDDGDAATARTTLAAIGGVTDSFSANTLSISIPLGTGNTLLIQGGTGSLAADTTGTITFATAYNTAPVCIVDGGSSNVSHEGDVHASAAASTTGIAICNSNGSATCTFNWLAIGKA